VSLENKNEQGEKTNRAHLLVLPDIDAPDPIKWKKFSD
jgi:hypothetical protein